ncbi:ROK family transcriptional regulator [Streptomyces physcomitrii]|uniref:ROK family transcriptional regulator n=1 Tax=Streptomyces physcomitrii TaxID=2724184 RepID=A0ABX1H662_9ACTN|nr:ROK family transcriptional regulator [Streptomyces physcomitrii]NKI43857.1 ROK family transcriptional regulator [Streptomyces physcomitrii]
MYGEEPPGAGPASQRDVRRRNLSLVLRTVRERGPLSRAAIAAATGLTRPTAASLADELRADGLLVEQGTVSSGRAGRPGRALALNDRGPAGCGLEVGVGHLGACVSDLRGEVRVRVRRPAANRGRSAPEVLAELTAVAEEALGRAAALGLRPVAAVLAVPGLVGPRPGTVVRAPNLGWQEVNLDRLWRLPLPLTVENEANLGALAELPLTPARHFVHVSAEAGIGAALVVDGQLLRGALGFAGELGHVPVRPGGRACPCGARGCLEQYAGEAAVLRAAGHRNTDGDAVAELARRAAAGEERVRAAVLGAGTALGIALAGAVNLLDPQAVVLGGAYAELADWLLPAMRRELAGRVTVRPWSPEALTASTLGRRGPLTGAAALTVGRILEDPGLVRGGG